MKQPNIFNPEQEAVLQYVPDFQSATFTVVGLGETLLPLAEEIQVAEATTPIAPVTAVQPTQLVETPKPAYEDFSTLEAREVLRRKINARFYDTFHRTNMYGLLVDRINEDRDVAFARGLGILGVTHCAKHEKAVAKLRQLV